MGDFQKILTGTEQSRFAGLAILCAVMAIILSIIFNSTDISISQRIGMIVFFLLFSIIPISLALFELTCISALNGSSKYCGWYGWFITAFITIYCFIIVISALTSMLTYGEATKKVNEYKEQSKMSPEDANQIAKDMMTNEDEKIKQEQKPEQMPEQMPSSPTNVVTENMVTGNSLSELSKLYSGLQEGSSDDVFGGLDSIFSTSLTGNALNEGFRSKSMNKKKV
jgi:uncharacterized membrane protein